MYRFLAFLFAFLAAAPAFGQLPAARLNSVFPCGARQATAVECTIAGADLEQASGLDFSHPGITAEPAGPNKFKVSVAADVPVGPYDVRAVTPRGLSNFRAFTVSDWAEVVEAEPDDAPGQARAVTLAGGRQRADRQADRRRLLPFHGQARASASSSTAGLGGSTASSTARSWSTTTRARSSATRATSRARTPSSTSPRRPTVTYVVKVWDFIYGGSGDHFYRLQIGSVPHLDAVIPAAVQPGRDDDHHAPGTQPARGTPVPASGPGPARSRRSAGRSSSPRSPAAS